MEGTKKFIAVCPKESELAYVGPTACPTCKTVFRNSPSCEMHQIKKHNKASDKLDKKPKQDKSCRYFCPVKGCKYSPSSGSTHYFSKRRQLKEHYRNNHDKRKFVCTVCNKSFPTRKLLTAHQQKECGTEFFCAQCDTSYNSNEALLTHRYRTGHINSPTKIKRYCYEMEEGTVATTKIKVKCDRVSDEKFDEITVDSVKIEANDEHQIVGDSNERITMDVKNAVNVEPMDLCHGEGDDLQPKRQRRREYTKGTTTNGTEGSFDEMADKKDKMQANYKHQRVDDSTGRIAIDVKKEVNVEPRDLCHGEGDDLQPGRQRPGEYTKGIGGPFDEMADKKDKVEAHDEHQSVGDCSKRHIAMDVKKEVKEIVEPMDLFHGEGDDLQPGRQRPREYTKGTIANGTGGPFDEMAGKKVKIEPKDDGVTGSKECSLEDDFEMNRNHPRDFGVSERSAIKDKVQPVDHPGSHTFEKQTYDESVEFSPKRSDFGSQVATNIPSPNKLPAEETLIFVLSSYQAESKGFYEKHLATHTGEKPFACGHCSYRCSRNGDLKKHVRKHTGEKPYVCNLCDARYSRHFGLKLHMRKHIGEKPFVCNICQFGFPRACGLKRHMLTHTGEKPFSCERCQFRCSQKEILTRHMTKHTGEKPFACDLCDFRCSRKTGLSSHKLTHSGEKPFACDCCDFRCSLKKRLKIHMRKHTI